MDTTRLKNYAPKARRDFIEAVKARAAKFGISKSAAVEMVVRDEVAVIYGEAYPKEAHQQREGILELVKTKGFEPAMEAMAYTWFNRLVAMRYMELHGFLDHGYRVLSHPEGDASPEILQHARHVDLPGLDQGRVTELLLAGNKDEELYRLLLLAQCHALHVAMPFLFEPIDDATELLLPDNLLHSDSLIRKMVNDVPEGDWESIEVVGWLYQFYISEKKDQVIGKVVKSEDIPAATQLFTPNWIVKYMVQNSLGAQWLATYPDSPLKGQMEYYIEPAGQTPEVMEQLAKLQREWLEQKGLEQQEKGLGARGQGLEKMGGNHGSVPQAPGPYSLSPEHLTLIDPASGSGHILVEAYEVFKAIYLERGYQKKDIPQLILEKNLFGLEICPRAAQLTGFALMMKGRADDRRLFDRGVKLNVMALVDSAEFDAEGLAKGVGLAGYGLKPGDLTELKQLFEHATTFGSLIQVPEGLAEKLSVLQQLSEASSQDLFVSAALKRLGPLLRQSEMLAAQYDAVVANPPYMGGNGMNAEVKRFARDYFPETKSDLFAMFIERAILQAKNCGSVGVVAPYVWMFLFSYERFRERIIDETTLSSLVQLEYNAFEPACIPVATFTLMRCHVPGVTGSYIKLSEFKGHQNQAPRALEAIKDPNCGWHYRAKPDTFKIIPGSPVAFWVGDAIRRLFAVCERLGSVCETQAGLSTTDNNKFLRLWWEISSLAVMWTAKDSQQAKESGMKWFPHNKGGQFRRWSGNQEFVVDWEDDGRRIKHSVITKYPYLKGNPNFVVHDYGNYFRPSVSWSEITSGPIAFRSYPEGLTFSNKGMSAFPKPPCSQEQLLALCNSNLTKHLCGLLNPSLSFGTGNFNNLPAAFVTDIAAEARAVRLIESSRLDWNAYERSWDFQSLPILTVSSDPTPALESSYTAWITQNRDSIAEMKRLEEENNRLFIDAYGLADELTPDVPIEQITLTVNPAYRYGGKLTEEELWTRFRQDTMEELVSYAIGCMMGRYSLDEPGLIYAHSGNKDFDSSRYPSFRADDDGIIPLTDTQWFDDDAVSRLVEFISVAWAPAHLEQNLTFLADNLKPKANESNRETIRRYLCDSFFKDHLQTYKKRPIYWLFSSGKHKTLQCLVYLHRYNEGTLARMRMDYCVPLLGRLAARIDSLAKDIEAAGTTAQANKLRRESELRKKQLEELRTFDEKLRHYADQRISLDLDDGVKVNYGKFGDLLAEVKAVTGGAPEA